MKPDACEYLFGLNPAFEALRAGRRKIHAALLNQACTEQPRFRKLIECLQAQKIEIHYGEKGRLFDACGSQEHQGVVLETGPYPYKPLEEVLRLPHLVLIDNVEDPHNVGAILRSAEGFGFTGVLLPNKGCPEIYPSVVKASAGASEHLQIAREHNAVFYARKAVEAGHQLLALDMHGRSLLEDLQLLPGTRVCLAIGGEDRAVGQYILNASTQVLKLRQYGRVNSLNASVAAAIAMHELARLLNR